MNANGLGLYLKDDREFLKDCKQESERMRVVCQKGRDLLNGHRCLCILVDRGPLYHKIPPTIHQIPSALIAGGLKLSRKPFIIQRYMRHEPGLKRIL